MAITNTALATAMADLISHWQDFQDEHQAWLAGTVGGGPNLDGKYPLTDYLGVTVLVTSPAQLESDVESLVTGAAGSATAAAASATAAAASATTATTQASNASSSASAASASASAASASASSASSSATTATAQASAASASATAAAASAAQAEAAAGALTDPGFNGVMTWNDTSNLPEWSALSGFALRSTANTFADTQTISRNSGALLNLVDADAGTGLGRWALLSLDGSFFVYTQNDAGSGVENAIALQRNASSEVTSMALAADTITLNGVASSDFARKSQSNTFTSETALVIAHDTGYIPFYNTALSTRSGYLQMVATGNAILKNESSGGHLYLQATGATVRLSANGGTTDHVIIDDTGKVQVSGVGRFSGWYSTGGGGTAAEIGVSSDIAQVLAYNRDTTTFKQLTLNASQIAFAYSSGALPNYADDSAAATGGIAVGCLYRNGSVVQVRVS